MMTGIDWGMGLSGWLWIVLGVGLFVVVVWVLVSAIARQERPATDDPLHVLEARFARGEITPAEYEQARRLLGI